MLLAVVQRLLNTSAQEQYEKKESLHQNGKKVKVTSEFKLLLTSYFTRFTLQLLTMACSALAMGQCLLIGLHGSFSCYKEKAL